MHELLVVSDSDMLTHLNAGDLIVLLVIWQVPGVHHLDLEVVVLTEGRDVVSLLLGKSNSSRFSFIFS